MHRNKKLIFCMIFLWNNIFYSVSFAEKLVDRLVLEIDRQTYSQRYLEAYFIVKTMLSAHLHYPLARIDTSLNASNYENFFEIFAQDMLISTEAKKLARYQPSADFTDTLLKMFSKEETFRSDLLKRLEVLDISQGKLTRIVSDVIQVDEFRKNKDRSYKKQNKWLEDLKDKHMSRFFLEAKIFQQI